MTALYALCREVDDVADDEAVAEGERRRQLAAWRADLRLASEGGAPEFAVNRELQPAIEQYRLPFDLFDELIQGVEMDLDLKRYPDYAGLDLYCHRVASVVGLLSIEVFGYTQPRCRDYAVALGKALQLTNILRDVDQDGQRGRIYLPLSELERYEVPESDILEHRYSDRYRQLAASVAQRATAFYREARALLPREDRRTMVAAEMMGAVYWHLLLKLERKHFDVFAPRPTRLSRPHKLYLILRTWWRLKIGANVSGYGRSPTPDSKRRT